MKKILSLALALVMVLSLAAFSVSAENYEEKVIEAKWNFGYVGSSTNTAGFVNVLNPNGGSYSYSDVIDMGPAGSTISFADEASGYASAAAYVFSFWKKNGEEFELDLEANNIPGYSITATRDYEFVTTEDNQAIRVTYRSEQAASYTPADSARPVVTLTSPVAETTAAATTSAPTTTAAPTTQAPTTTTSPTVTPAPETGDTTSIVVLASLIAVITLAGVAVGKKR